MNEEQERERKVLREQAADSGKPAEIIEKMVDGRMRKFYEEVCLLEQTFVIDNETKIAKVLEVASKEIGSDIKILGSVMVLVKGSKRKRPILPPK